MSLSHSSVAHRWAHKRPGKGTNLFSNGVTLQSYATVIARHFGTDTVLLSTYRYSSSTSKHQCHARGASTHLTQVFVTEVPGYAPTRDWALMEIEEQLKAAIQSQIKASRAKRYAAEWLNSAQCHTDTAKYLAKQFKIRKNLTKLKTELNKQQVRALEKAKKFEAERRRVFEKNLARWKANDPKASIGLGPIYGQTTYLRRVGDVVETSKGIKIPYDVFARYVRRYKDTKEVPERVLDFRVTRVDDKHVVIGCHDISWDEINEVMKA